MNTNLQARLREVVRRCDVSNNEVEGISEDRAIAEIIQAFGDAGYVQIKKYEALKALKNPHLRKALEGAGYTVNDRAVDKALKAAKRASGIEGEGK